MPRQVQRRSAGGGCDFGVLAVANIKHGYIENTFAALPQCRNGLDKLAAQLGQPLPLIHDNVAPHGVSAPSVGRYRSWPRPQTARVTTYPKKEHHPVGTIKKQNLPQGFMVELRHDADGRYCVRIWAPEKSGRDFALFIGAFFTYGITLAMMGRDVHKDVYFHSQKRAFGFYNKVVQTAQHNRPS